MKKTTILILFFLIVLIAPSISKESFSQVWKTMSNTERLWFVAGYMEGSNMTNEESVSSYLYPSDHVFVIDQLYGYKKYEETEFKGIMLSSTFYILMHGNKDIRLDSKKAEMQIYELLIKEKEQAENPDELEWFGP